MHFLRLAPALALVLSSVSLAQPKSSPDGGKASVLQALQPDISFNVDVALAAFSNDPPLPRGGHDPTQTGFNLQQLELAVSKAVDPYFHFNAHVVFMLDEVEIEEVYATTSSLPWNLQVRAGQFLTRFGRWNGAHLHTWDFIDQPFALSRVFGGEGNRGLGVELSYLTPLPWFSELVYSVTEAEGEGTARSFLGVSDRSVDSVLDFQHTAAAKQFFELNDDWSLSWGLSAAVGPNASAEVNYSNLFGTDLSLKFRPLSGSEQLVAFQTEWFYRRRQVPSDVLQDVNGYAYVFWRFARRWGTALRHEYGSPALNRHGTVTADPLDPFWTGSRHRTSANVTFWPTEFSRLRLQGSADMMSWQSRPDWSLFLALSFSVGPHGAHTF